MLQDIKKEMMIKIYGKDYLNPKKWKDYCFIWKILTEKERKMVRKDILWMNSLSIDLCHIFPRTYLQRKYDKLNLVFISRGFHWALTNYESFFEKGKKLDKYQIYLYYLKANSKQLQEGKYV